MLTLKDVKQNKTPLSVVLKESGKQHRSYNMYTSMERALGVLLNGEIFLSNGAKWNDVNDRYLMDSKNAYGLCLSCSTRENIAMWMLYGAENGKKGAMLKLYPSVMKELVEAATVELGSFNKNGKFKAAHVLVNKKDFESYLTDVVYTDACSDGKVRLTLGESHITEDMSVLNDPDVFHKNYAWSYEKECKYIIKLKSNWSAIAKREALTSIRVKMPSSSLNEMSEERLVRSPVYSGGVACGVCSELTNDVDWDL